MAPRNRVFVKLTGVFAFPSYLYFYFSYFWKFKIIWFGASHVLDIWKRLDLQIVKETFLKLIFVW